MSACVHPTADRGCPHVFVVDTYIARFRGRDPEYVCTESCSAPLIPVCAKCRTGEWTGIVNPPPILDERSDLAFARDHIGLPELGDLQPVHAGERSLWIGLARDALYAIDVDRRAVHEVLRFDPIADPLLRVSRDGTLAAIAARRDLRGTVIDLAAKRTLLPFGRDIVSHTAGEFPIAFVDHGGRTLLVYAPEWNRLDVVDPRTAEVLTPRDSPVYEDRGGRPDHFLDYFHCALLVSPDQRTIAEDGWVWHPTDIVTTWSVERWLTDNVWESEDGPSRRELTWSENGWERPLCWLDNTRLVVSGYGQDHNWMLPAVRIFDVTTGDEERWFPGPKGALAYATELFASDGAGTTAWNLERGTRLATDPTLRDLRFHPTARTFLALDGTVAIPRGADTRWAVRDFAARIARERAFDDLPVLGDALEAAGCTDPSMIAHCHAREPHVDRCWVIDRLLPL